MGLLLSFNSIKVRLELYCTKDKEVYIKFQFHKGTIRTGTYHEVYDPES